MVTIDSCPICGGKSFTDVFKAPYFRGNGEEFNIQECGDCKLWVTNPRPDDDALAGYYDTDDYISHTNKKEGIIDHMYHWVREYAIRKKVALINGLVPSKGRLMDYGAGTGYYLSAAQKNGWEVTGVEPSQGGREVAKENHDLELLDPAGLDWSGIPELDCITLWHVLEHLPGLTDHVKQFGSALKKGGYLIIAVPNHESDDARHYGKNWAALDVPLHLWHFKKDNIRDLASRNDFELVDVKNMPFDSYYVSLLSEKIQSGRSHFVKAFYNGWRSNRKGLSKKNASSLIYILKRLK